MNNNYLWIKIKCSNYYKLFRKLNEIGIEIYETKVEKESVYIKTNYESFQKAKKYLISYNISVYKYLGLKKYRNIFNKYKVFIITLLIFFCFLAFLNFVTLKILIVTSNKEIKNLLRHELSKNGVTKIGIKKNHKEIEKIVKNILDNNKDSLEWVEIKYDGLIVIVNVTPKTNNKIEKKNNHCNLIATKDAKIISMNVNRGVPLKKINEYVTKGEIVISGDIIHNEEIKNTVCAGGEVYGEVWYKVNVKMPLEEEIKNYTGKKRYNLNIKTTTNDYDIFKSRIKEKEKEKVNLYKFNDFEINIIKEKEYVIERKKISENEAYNKAISKGLEKIQINLNKKEEIISQNVLKKEVNNSTIYLEIFVVTKENIVSTNMIEEEY